MKYKIKQTKWLRRNRGSQQCLCRNSHQQLAANNNNYNNVNDDADDKMRINKIILLTDRQSARQTLYYHTQSHSKMHKAIDISCSAFNSHHLQIDIVHIHTHTQESTE